MVDGAPRSPGSRDESDTELVQAEAPADGTAADRDVHPRALFGHLQPRQRPDYHSTSRSSASRTSTATPLPRKRRSGRGRRGRRRILRIFQVGDGRRRRGRRAGPDRAGRLVPGRGIASAPLRFAPTQEEVLWSRSYLVVGAGHPLLGGSGPLAPCLLTCPRLASGGGGSGR